MFQFIDYLYNIKFINKFCQLLFSYSTIYSTKYKYIFKYISLVTIIYLIEQRILFFLLYKLTTIRLKIRNTLLFFIINWMAVFPHLVMDVIYFQKLEKLIFNNKLFYQMLPYLHYFSIIFLRIVMALFSCVHNRPSGSQYAFSHSTLSTLIYNRPLSSHKLSGKCYKYPIN